MARHCGKCGKPGHYQSTCGTVRVVTQVQQPVLTQGSDGSTQENLPVPATSQVSDLAKPGLWIVSEQRKKIAGKIVLANKEEIIYESIFGALVETTHVKLEEASYQIVELSPKMLQWIG